MASSSSSKPVEKFTVDPRLLSAIYDYLVKTKRPASALSFKEASNCDPLPPPLCGGPKGVLAVWWASAWNISCLARGTEHEVVDRWNNAAVFPGLPRGRIRDAFEASTSVKRQSHESRLDSYVLDFMIQNNFEQTSHILLSEAGISPSSPDHVRAPNGLLHEWWHTFFPLFSQIYPIGVANTESGCKICGQDFQDVENLVNPRPLVCGHMFHADCYYAWIISEPNDVGDDTCPVCKRVVLPFSEDHLARLLKNLREQHFYDQAYDDHSEGEAEFDEEVDAEGEDEEVDVQGDDEEVDVEGEDEEVDAQVAEFGFKFDPENVALLHDHVARLREIDVNDLVARATNAEPQGDMCRICGYLLVGEGRFDIAEPVTLKCGHIFHQCCIFFFDASRTGQYYPDWFSLPRTGCPMCLCLPLPLPGAPVTYPTIREEINEPHHAQSEPLGMTLDLLSTLESCVLCGNLLPDEVYTSDWLPDEVNTEDWPPVEVICRTLPCGHRFHNSCFGKWLQENEESACPSCNP